jgi:hypothetical protein
MLIRIALLAVVVGLVFAPRIAAAIDRGPDGYYRTGAATQTANHWPFTMDVFAIWHDVRQPPATKSRQAMIDLDADKRFTMRMLRDLDGDKLRAGLRDGYHRNGFTDDAAIDRFLAALPPRLSNGAALWIVYDAAAGQTRLVVDGGQSSSISGAAFMRATWSIWFGRSKPADIGDALMRNL